MLGVRRRGKHLIVDFEGFELLLHLMSAGRLQLYDKRAGPRDRTSRLLVRLEDGRELRLREFGTKQRAWAKLVPKAAPTKTSRSRRSVPRLGPTRRRSKACSTRRVRCTRCCATSG